MARNEFEKERGISAFWIRMIGVAGMIWSFITATDKIAFKNTAVTECMIWFSYTLFAFLLAEGVNKTSNRLLYLRRFAVFTLLAEPAFDFYTFGKFWNTETQSIMLTLFTCLSVMLICDYIKRRFRNIVLDILAIILFSILAIKFTEYTHCLFGRYGVLIAMLFYTSYDLTYYKTFEFVVLIFYSIYAKISTIITVTINGLQYTVPITVFTFLALIVTWFYNENRGPNKLWLKVLFYLIYPLTLLVFGLAEKIL